MDQIINSKIDLDCFNDIVVDKDEYDVLVNKVNEFYPIDLTEEPIDIEISSQELGKIKNGEHIIQSIQLVKNDYSGIVEAIKNNKAANISLNIKQDNNIIHSNITFWNKFDAAGSLGYYLNNFYFILDSITVQYSAKIYINKTTNKLMLYFIATGYNTN